MGIRDNIERMIRDDDLEGLLTRTGEIHGHHCVGSAMGVIAAHRAMKELNVTESTGMEHLIAILETNNCFSDGIQIVTGCTFGNNALVYRDYGKTAFTLIDREGRGVRISAKPEAGNILRDENSEATELYNKVVKERTATPKEERRMIELNRKHCYDILSISADEIFKIEQVDIEPSAGYSSILESRICAKCGEKVIETRTVEKNGESLCIPCAGSEFHQLDWSGISQKNT
ncbi:MAG: FmdE family protein [Candidatus Bathyarchaeia archaeon]